MSKKKTTRCKLCLMEARFSPSESNVSVGRTFGVSKDAVRRHKMHMNADPFFNVPDHLVTQRGITRRLEDGSYEKITWKPQQATLGATLKETLEQDLEALFAKPVTLPAPDVPVSQFTTLMFPTDLQTGKVDINGGTEEMIARVRASVESIRSLLGENRAEELIIGDLGDIIENFYNTSSQRETNDAHLLEQQRIARRLMTEIIVTLAPYANKLVYVSVPSNHCTVRIGPKSPAATPDNDFGIEISHQLEEIFAGRPGYEHLVFVRPSNKHYEHAVYRSEVSNSTFFFAHGHKKNKPQMLGQLVSDLAAGRIDGVEDVDIAFFGHFHSMHLYQWHGRWIFVCPSSDGGSSWYTNQTGQESTAGILMVDVREGMWSSPHIH